MSVQGLEHGHGTMKGDCPRTREWSLHNLGFKDSIMVTGQLWMIAQGHGNDHCIRMTVQGLENGHCKIMGDCPGTRESLLHD